MISSREDFLERRKDDLCVTMKIVLYKDRDGTTISQDFISQLDPQPQGVEIIDSPYLKSSLDIAKATC